MDNQSKKFIKKPGINIAASDEPLYRIDEIFEKKKELFY